MDQDIIASPEPRGPRSDRARIALAALGGGLSVLLLGAGAVAVSGMANADDNPTPAPSSSSDTTGPARPSPPGGGMGMRGGFGMGGFGALGHLGDALHGSAVVKDDDGNFVTYEAQRGEVTAVSASSVSVKSEDGYEHTYVVTDDTVVNRDGDIADISTGDEVLVVATQQDGSSTATRVVNLADLKERLDDMRERFEDRFGGTAPGPWHHGDHGDKKGGTAPAPTPSESSTA